MAACTLNYSPVVNNVEKCGGLPEEICSAAKHIMANGGGGRQRAIAAAVNFVKFVCATGQSKNFLKSNPTHKVSPEKRARACANVAAWERLVACMKGKPPTGGKAATQASRDGTDLESVLWLIDVLDLSDRISGAFDAAEDEEDDPDAKALCHTGACSIPLVEHEAADFSVTVDSKAVVDVQEEDGRERGIIIRGLAASYSVDREDEAFEPGAFDRGIQEFMKNPVLAYMHSTDVAETVKGPTKYVQLGKVLTLEKSQRGLEFSAYLPRPEHGGFMANVYEQVKAGIMRGVSVGGRFYRHHTLNGPRIYQADLHEVTLAPKPVNPEALVDSVEAVKSMMDLSLEWSPLDKDLAENMLEPNAE